MHAASSDDALGRTSEEIAACTRRMRRLACHLIGDATLADDVTQDAWATALRRPVPIGVPLARWIQGVVRNVSWRTARSERRRRRHEHDARRSEAIVVDPSQAALRAESHRRVVDAVLELPEPYRATILLRYFEDLTPGAIAVRTGEPAATVRSRVKRGLAILRERLDAGHGGDRRAWLLALAPLASRRAPLDVLPIQEILAMKAATKVLAATAIALLVLGGAALFTTSSDEGTSGTDGAVRAGPAAAPAVRPAAARSVPETVPPAPTGELVLLVRDQSGSPVRDARAEVETWTADGFAPSSTTTTAHGVTGADGTATMSGLEVGRDLRVIVRAVGHAAAAAPFRIPPGSSTVTVAVRLVRGTGLRGAVYDSDGSAIRGAALVVRDRTGGFLGRSVSDASGRYAFEALPVGVVDLWAARLEDRPCRIGLVQLPTAADFDVELPTRSHLVGTVREAVSGRALAGAVVRIDPVTPTQGRAMTTSSADGTYHVDDLGTTVVNALQVSLPGFRMRPLTGEHCFELALRLGETTRCDIVMEPASDHAAEDVGLVAVTGRVLDPECSPVPFARVGASSADGEGRFRVETASSGPEGRLSVWAPGYAASELVLIVPAGASAVERDVTLARAPKVNGRVTQSDGTPPPEGTVVTILAFPVRPPGSRSPTTIERDASIGRDGVYSGEVSVVGEASFRVSVRPPGRAPVNSDDVRLTEATEYAVDVKIPAGSVVAGRVVDAGTGLAVVGAVLRSQPEGIAVAVTDAQGRFSWTCAPSRAQFDASAPGYLLRYVTWDGRSEIAVSLDRAGDIRGSVTRPDGTPIANIEVLTQRRSRGLTGPDGSFVIPGLDAGVYRLEVGPALSTVDAQRAFVDGVRAGTRDLRIVLQPAAAIAGKLLDDKGGGVGGAMIVATPTGAQEPLFRAVTSADGSFRIAGLTPSATYGVCASAGPRPDGSIESRYAPAMRLDVRAGTDDLELRFATWLSIEGTLEDENGAPMPLVVLTAGGALATTDERGHFRFAQLSPGTYPISAARTRDRKSAIEVRGGEAVAAGGPSVRLVGVRSKR